MTPLPDYVISLAHPGEPLLESSFYTSRTIEDIPHGSDGGTVTVRFDHIADNDGCRDFTDEWANTNQDGRKKKGQKEWNQMQKESKKNKLKKMFDKDGELFARLVAEAIANGAAVPSAGAADDARSHVRTSARARVRAESNAGERLSRENSEQTRAGEEKKEDDDDTDAGARNHAIDENGGGGTSTMNGGEWYEDHTNRRLVLLSLTMLTNATRAESSQLKASRHPGYEDSYAAGFDDRFKKSLCTRWRRRTQPEATNRESTLHRRHAIGLVRRALASGDNSVLAAEERRDLLTDLGNDIAAIRLFGSDELEDFTFHDTSTGELVESAEELLDELRAALATRASTASSTSQADAASPPDEHTGVEDDTGLAGYHEDTTTTADPRMNFKVIGEIGRTTIVKTRKALTVEMIDEALSEGTIVKAEGSDPKYYAPVMQRLRSELLTTKANGDRSVNLDAPALDAAWLHDGIKKMNHYYKDEKNQLQDYGGCLYDKFSAAVQAKDLVTMALCLRQVEVAEGNSGKNPFVCSPWYRQYEVDLYKDPSYTPAIRDTNPIEIDEGPKVYELQSDDDEDDDGGNDGTGTVGTGGAGRATANIKAESDVEMEEAGELGEERAVGAKSKATEMEADREGRGDDMVSKRQKKTNGSASNCNDGLRAVVGNVFAGADAAMVLGDDASNGESASAAATAVPGGTGGRKTTGEGGYDDMEEEKEEGAEDDAPLVIGTKIRKFFPECNSWHNGGIEAVPAPGDKSDYFHARYDDGDDEDLDESEAQEHAQCWKDWNATQSNGGHTLSGKSAEREVAESRKQNCGRISLGGGARLTSYYNPADTMMLARCFALLDPRTRDLDFEKASQKPGYALMYPSDKPKRERNNQNQQWLRQKGNTVASQSSLKCIREAEANADAANGQVLNKVFEGKRLVDLADDITAVPSLSSDAISAYAFIKRYTGELVESTADRRRQVEEALATRAPFAENGGSIVDGANSGATAQAAMPSAVTSTPPAQDILEMLSVLVLPRSTQHVTVRDALRNNPSAVAFAAASEEMAQQQAAATATATLLSGEAGGSGGSAWGSITGSATATMGGTGMNGVTSKDDLLTKLADLPASVLDGSVRDALRINPSGLRLAAMAMGMLKEGRQGQVHQGGATTSYM